jgi:RND family efflux transporter MFP subunit
MIKKISHHAGKAYRASAHSLKTSYQAAPPQAQKLAKRGLIIAFLLIVVIAGTRSYLTYRETQRRLAEIAAGPSIRVATVAQSPGEHTITLIGETRPYQEATLYAKVSGYLKSVKVDKGDKVKEGAFLAFIESPETDQAYQGALADFKNKKAIHERMNKLFERKLVSQQELDQASADYSVSSARLHTEETLKNYETIRAPFAGTVTSRFADPGALVQNATSSQTSALPIVTVSTLDKLRVDVFVDQHDAPFIEKDNPIEITLSDRPGFKLLGKVSRISGELDPRTKMLLTEIDLPNANQELVAGSFVQVAMKVKSPPFLQAPVESLVMKANKPTLSVVTKDNTITFKPVELLNNDGQMVWISSGVSAGEIVALNIGETVPEGGKVRPRPQQGVNVK